MIRWSLWYNLWCNLLWNAWWNVRWQVITVGDLADYQARWMEPVQVGHDFTWCQSDWNIHHSDVKIIEPPPLWCQSDWNCHQVSLESLNSTFYSVPPPGSGAILAYILNMLDLYKIKPQDDNPLLFHRIVETFKWAKFIKNRHILGGHMQCELSWATVLERRPSRTPLTTLSPTSPANSGQGTGEQKSTKSWIW